MSFAREQIGRFDMTRSTRNLSMPMQRSRGSIGDARAVGVCLRPVVPELRRLTPFLTCGG